MSQSVLVVDDSPEICELFALAFESVGFNVATAADGQEALEHLKNHPTDIMTLDIDMPVKSGLDVLREMQTLSNVRHTKVIVATGSDTIRHADEAAHADLVLVKPIRFKQMLDLAWGFATTHTPYMG